MSTFAMLLISVGIPSFIFALMSGTLIPREPSNEDVNPLNPPFRSTGQAKEAA